MNWFLFHCTFSSFKSFSGASVIFTVVCPMSKEKRVEIFSKFSVWKNCIWLRAERTKDVFLSETTREELTLDTLSSSPLLANKCFTLSGN